MSVSMKTLFSRRGLPNTAISLRNSLLNHLDNTKIGLREADKKFGKLDDGKGYNSGCRVPHTIEIGIGIGGKNVAQILPAWVPVGNPRDHRERARTVEGILLVSKITYEDFPLKPWHTNYDWNFFVHLDPQYRYLLSDIARKQNSKSYIGTNKIVDLMECEWDSAFLPLWAIPPIKSRVIIIGRWIYDCGHPTKARHRTEIHPPKAIISFRSEATEFQGNKGPTQANNAVVYIGRKGGYIDQRINNQDYTFDLYLPPKPHPDAKPLSNYVPKAGPKIPPKIIPFPEQAPKLLRVTIPLKGISAQENEYGAVISGGWNDPASTELEKANRFRVTINKIHFFSSSFLHTGWMLYIGINGRWHHSRLPNPLDVEHDLNRIRVVLDLHQNDSIHITACGFRVQDIHGAMGKETGIKSTVIGKANNIKDAREAAKKIRNNAHHLAGIKGERTENKPIELFAKTHYPVMPGEFTELSSKNLGPYWKKAKIEYELSYKIEQ